MGGVGCEVGCGGSYIVVYENGVEEVVIGFLLIVDDLVVLLIEVDWWWLFLLFGMFVGEGVVMWV